MLHDRPEGLDETRRRSLAPSCFLRPARRASRRSEVEARRLAFLRDLLRAGVTWIQPEKDEESPLGYVFRHVETVAGLAPESGRAFLEDLAEAGYLRREIHGFVLLCPSCAQRTVEHVFLAPGEKAPCLACGEAFSFEEGASVRIHGYVPTRLACRAVALGRLEPAGGEHVPGPGRARPRAPRSGRPRGLGARRLPPWQGWRAG